MFATAFGICGVRAKPPDSWLRSRSCQTFFADEVVDAPVRAQRAPGARDPQPLHSAGSSIDLRTSRGSRLHPLSLAQKTPRTPTAQNVRRLSAFNGCPDAMSDDESCGTYSTESSGASYLEELSKCKANIATRLRETRLEVAKAAGVDGAAQDADIMRRVNEAIGSAADLSRVLSSSDTAASFRSAKKGHHRGTRSLSRAGSMCSVEAAGAEEAVSAEDADRILTLDERYEQGRVGERIHEIKELMHLRGLGPPEPQHNLNCMSREAREIEQDREKQRVDREVAREVRRYQANMTRKFSRLGFNGVPVESAELDPARAVRQAVLSYHEHSSANGKIWPGLEGNVENGAEENGLTMDTRQELEEYVSGLRGDNLDTLQRIWPSASARAW